ncbi:MAG: DNA alkylation repair protein [Prevotellaceae bacterium]|jgi:3-methyladenine DNA glycosylase AlkD|nr:DNA alkylation repair protein [Prevotellaceae bacterium]
MKEIDDILSKFEQMRNNKNIVGMARFGIRVTEKDAFGVSVVLLRKMAKAYKKNQPLAEALWKTGWHEAQLIASMIADKHKFTPKLMDKWVKDFDSWDTCDQCCVNIFRELPYAYDKIYEYAPSEEEFVRRTAFSLIATLAVGDKIQIDKIFIDLLKLIEQYATDERNFVRKAVNWALRGIGKRNLNLHLKALKLAERLSQSADKTARWIGKDAYRELTNSKIIGRIKERER